MFEPLDALMLAASAIWIWMILGTCQAGMALYRSHASKRLAELREGY